jgi:hypothetical protein
VKEEEFHLLESNYFSAPKVEIEPKKAKDIIPQYQQKSNEIRIEIPRNIS